ncbi:CHC2 zinc finger domain-containing protein [Peribacillus frigoritolerans]|uniref:CHC2 zinc finger domain-containing protein n=1 Tax=Peribacillus frigoritolerans TaxID=450367 RepID=UPI0024C1C35A|nr:CHC2 zinc finger domain-containing protein [Peribacillus frigoritolerans]WHX62344.1 CHC2 zinc finger domain-containing protein [Peribacillus frigoritolerans]
MWMKSCKNDEKLTPIETIQLVKDSIGIEAVLEYYAGISLENVKGRKTKIISCIFHQERTPSLAITPSKNVFHCFGCRAKGDIITLVSLVKNVSQARAAYILAEDFELLQKAAPKLQTIKTKAEDKELVQAFKQKEKEMTDFLFNYKNQLKSTIKRITKQTGDLDRLERVYGVISKIDMYLELMWEADDISNPQERVKNYIAANKFIGKTIYPAIKKKVEAEGDKFWEQHKLN